MSIFDSIFRKKEGQESPIENTDMTTNEEHNVLAADIDHMIGQSKEHNAVVLKNTMNFIFETVCYFLSILALIVVIFFYRITPFDMFTDMLGNAEVKSALGGIAKIQDLSFSVRLIVSFVGVLCFILARMLHALRHSNNSNVKMLKSAIALQKKLRKLK